MSCECVGLANVLCHAPTATLPHSRAERPETPLHPTVTNPLIYTQAHYRLLTKTNEATETHMYVTGSLGRRSLSGLSGSVLAELVPASLPAASRPAAFACSESMAPRLGRNTPVFL